MFDFDTNIGNYGEVYMTAENYPFRIVIYVRAKMTESGDRIWWGQGVVYIGGRNEIIEIERYDRARVIEGLINMTAEKVEAMIDGMVAAFAEYERPSLSSIQEILREYERG